MGNDRHISLPLDSGGGGEGGGSGGAGGGSWSVVGLGGGTPEEPDSDGATSDGGAHIIDRFTRSVSAPTLAAGGSAGTMVAAGQAESNRQFYIAPWVLAPGQDDTVYTDRAFFWTAGRHDRFGSYHMHGQAHTARPTWSACSGLEYCFIGFRHIEQWFKWTAPAHPSDQNGITFTITRGGASGYQGALDVVVLSSQPAAMGQGSKVGELVGGGTQTIYISGSSIPAEGSALYIGLRPTWSVVTRASVFGYKCGWPSPYGWNESDTDSSGAPWAGYSGDTRWYLPTAATWQIRTGTDSDFGATIDLGDSPVGGPFPWVASGQDGYPDYGIDADGLYTESTAAASKTLTLYGPGEDEDMDDGPWSMYDGWRVDVLWEVDAVGLTGQAGTRALELVSAAEGQRCVVRVHLGDGDDEMGISADGGDGTEYVAKTFVADTRYVVALDIRSTFLRAKVWADEGRLSEPALWDVQVPIALGADEDDHFDLRMRVGNIISSQRLTIRRVTAYASGRLGDTIVGELVGLVDGAARTFPTAHQYVGGSLVAAVNGIASVAVVERSQEADFTLDIQPTEDSVLRCRYVIAGGDAPE